VRALEFKLNTTLLTKGVILVYGRKTFRAKQLAALRALVIPELQWLAAV
jgi:hypothetical protein